MTSSCYSIIRVLMLRRVKVTSGITFASSLSRCDTSHFTYRVSRGYLARVHRSTFDAIKRLLALRANSEIISRDTPLLCLGVIARRHCLTALRTHVKNIEDYSRLYAGNPPALHWLRSSKDALSPAHISAPFLPRDLHSIRRKYKGRRHPLSPSRARLHPYETERERLAEKNPFDTLTPAANRLSRG